MKYLSLIMIIVLFSCNQSKENNSQANSNDDKSIGSSDPVLKDKIKISDSVNSKIYDLSSEKILFSFNTETSGEVSLSLSQEKVLIYRNTSAGDFLHVFEDDLKDKLPLLTYSYYLRGGGAANAGMDNNYVSFKTDVEEIEIYDEYYAEDTSYTVGLRIKNIKTNKTQEVRGDYDSKKGSLIDFRSNKLIPVEENF